MILTCPQCSTRYSVDTANFPASGRNVRCAKCGLRWLQKPLLFKAEPEMALAEQTIDPELADRSIAPQWIRHEGARRNTRSSGQATARSGMLAGWAGLALLLIAGGWALFSFRNDVASYWPQSASLYRVLGLRVNTTGIQFAAVTHRVETENGENVLVVTGELVNTSARDRIVPEIRIALTDSSQHELYHWPVLPDVPLLKPGQSAPFRARLTNPPGAMHNIEVTFSRSRE